MEQPVSRRVVKHGYSYPHDKSADALRFSLDVSACARANSFGNLFQFPHSKCSIHLFLRQKLLNSYKPKAALR